ncbi:MAG: hypothetical protein HY244_17390 [Rhizobiales bacterium]|nr:hypothetical protein [Hyphomicrobiales bacterium]
MKVSRDFLAVLAFSTIPIWILVFLVGGLYVSGPSCETKIEKKLPDVSGIDFEISTTMCWGSSYSTIAASRKGEKHRTILLEYDPITWIGLPTISMPGSDRIVIAAPWVSAVFAKRDHWRGMRIEYDIGKISYPDSVVRRLDDEK